MQKIGIKHLTKEQRTRFNAITTALEKYYKTKTGITEIKRNVFNTCQQEAKKMKDEYKNMLHWLMETLNLATSETGLSRARSTTWLG